MEKPEWFKQETVLKILTSHESPNKIADVKSFSLDDATSKGENYASAIFLLSAEYTIEGDETVKKASFIVKCRLENEMMAAIEAEFNVFVRESQVYNLILKEIYDLMKTIGDDTKFGPKPILVDDLMIVQENLKTGGYKIEDVTKGLNYDFCKIIVEKLAKFHACNMVLYNKNPELFKYHMAGNVSEHPNPLHELYKNGIQTCIEYCSKHPDLEEFVPKLKEFAPKIVARMINVFSRSQHDRYYTLNHGDCWVNNFMFKRNRSTGQPEDVLFVDFQEGYFGSPGIDFNYFIFSSWTKETYVEHKDQLIADYQKVLVEVLEKLNYNQRLPTIEDIKKEIVSKGFHGLVTTTCLLPILTNIDPECADPMNFLFDTEEAISNRIKVYSNPRLEELLKLFLGEFVKFGIL